MSKEEITRFLGKQVAQEYVLCAKINILIMNHLSLFTDINAQASQFG